MFYYHPKLYIFLPLNFDAEVKLMYCLKHGKNGADCYNNNGHAVTVLTRQS